MVHLGLIRLGLPQLVLPIKGVSPILGTQNAELRMPNSQKISFCTDSGSSAVDRQPMKSKPQMNLSQRFEWQKG